MTDLINQRESADCVIAATAMFTDLPYDVVLDAAKAIGCYKRGRGIADTRHILEYLGFRQENVAFREPEKGPQGREFRELYLPAYYITPNVMRDMIWGRPAMISTKSLNQDGYHMVYYNGRRVMDPQEGRRGKKWFTDLEQLKPARAFVWRERE